jgi:LDH2 family malate/lactate/ureidoglycolate dehydrogenase
MLADAEGRPTTDPNALYRNPPGTIQLLGGQDFGYKGAALSLLVDLLATILAGDEAADSGRRGSNLAILAVAVDGGFAKRAERLGTHVRSSRPVDPDRPVLLPGERERAHRARAQGIVIDEPTWQALTLAARRHGVHMPPAVPDP